MDLDHPREVGSLPQLAHRDPLAGVAIRLRGDDPALAEWGGMPWRMEYERMSGESARGAGVGSEMFTIHAKETDHCLDTSYVNCVACAGRRGRAFSRGAAELQDSRRCPSRYRPRGLLAP